MRALFIKSENYQRVRDPAYFVFGFRYKVELNRVWSAFKGYDEIRGGMLCKRYNIENI